MTPEERERMNWLCLRIQDEKDQAKFMELVHELNALLERKHGRLMTKVEPKPEPKLRSN